MYVVDLKKVAYSKSKVLPNAIDKGIAQFYESLEAVSYRKITLECSIEQVQLQSQFFKQQDLFVISSIENSGLLVDVNEVLEEVGTYVSEIDVIDYRDEEEVYFYGAESLVADVENEIGICGVNQFSDEELFDEYCEALELMPFSFELDPFYKTSDVVLFTGDVWLICLPLITDKKIKKQMITAIKTSGKQIIAVSKEQVDKGVLNAIYHVENGLLYSKSGFDILTKDQKEVIEKYRPVRLLDDMILKVFDKKIRDIIL